uniref:Serpin domain-containing protein n=1 Tax=Romanomermis culicivorax TaxID=13658 RepID=A0A915HGN7_ROMCU
WPVEIRVKNNAQFAADFSKLLYKQNKEENFVFSPVSLEMLFAMLWEDSDLNCVRLYVSSLRNASQEYNTDETTLKFSSILAMDHRTPITFGFREALQSFPSAEFV